jgi:hypothetical protein
LSATKVIGAPLLIRKKRLPCFYLESRQYNGANLASMSTYKKRRSP